MGTTQRTPFHPFWMSLTPKQRDELAEKVGSKSSYLKLVALGHNRPSPELAKRLDSETKGLVPKEQMRPDIYE